jgi:GGDEF domain-containing protein
VLISFSRITFDESDLTKAVSVVWSNYRPRHFGKALNALLGNMAADHVLRYVSSRSRSCLFEQHGFMCRYLTSGS